MEPISITEDQRRALQAVYDAFRRYNAWPDFGRIDRPLRRPDYNPAGTFRTMPAFLLVPWRGGGVEPLRDDPMRLTLLGMSLCNGSQDDVERFLLVTRWGAEREAQFEPDDTHPVPQLTSADVESLLNLAGDDTGPIERLWAMFEVQRWGFGSGGGKPTDWHWDIERDIQRFAHARTAVEYGAAREAWVQEAAQVQAGRFVQGYMPSPPAAVLDNVLRQPTVVASNPAGPTPAASSPTNRPAFGARYTALQQSTVSPQARGQAFEQLWRDVLEFYGWEPRKIRISGEENDFTAVYKNRHILGEVRWFSEPMSGGKVREFAGKFEGRPQTIGLFISHSGFDDGALSVIRRSSSRTVILFGKDEIEAVLLAGADPGRIFDENLRDAYDHVAENPAGDRR